MLDWNKPLEVVVDGVRRKVLRYDRYAWNKSIVFWNNGGGQTLFAEFVTETGKSTNFVPGTAGLRVENLATVEIFHRPDKFPYLFLFEDKTPLTLAERDTIVEVAKADWEFFQRKIQGCEEALKGVYSQAQYNANSLLETVGAKKSH